MTRYPAWSPDGRWLAVEIKRGDQTHVGVVSKDGGAAEQRGGIWNVCAVSRRTREVTRLTHFKSPSGYVRYPAWSPRGNRIVFERSIRESSVWTVRPGP